ncbi:MAG: sulfite exporter TauE/SafE family protein [Clostridia bacterium]|nr:sulfite exporter TauE/SafE family protein [Clostridia bacterium]
MIEILISLISGIISGTGMGGGTVLIFGLVFILGVNQHTAQATNLIFFIPTSIMAIIVNIKNKNVDLKTALIISTSGIIGALVGANFAIKTDVVILKKYFGFFLAIIAIHEIYRIFLMYIKQKNTNNKSILKKIFLNQGPSLMEIDENDEKNDKILKEEGVRK